MKKLFVQWCLENWNQIIIVFPALGKGFLRTHWFYNDLGMVLQRKHCALYSWGGVLQWKHCFCCQMVRGWACKEFIGFWIGFCTTFKWNHWFLNNIYHCTLKNNKSSWRRHGSGRLATETEALARATFGARPRRGRGLRPRLFGQLREGSLLAARVSTAAIAAPTKSRCAPRPTQVQRRFREAAARVAPAEPAARDSTKRRPKRRASKPATKPKKKVEAKKKLCGHFAGKIWNTVKQY